MEGISLKWLQEHIKKRDFHQGAARSYFLKLIEEIGELSEVIRLSSRMQDATSIKGTIEEELYDVLYYVIAIANSLDIDLEKCFYLKNEINEERYALKVK